MIRGPKRWLIHCPLFFWNKCVTLQIEKLSNRRTKKKLYSIHPSIQILFVYVVFVLTWCLIIPKKNWLYLVTVLLGTIPVRNARQTQRWLNIDLVSWEKLERERVEVQKLHFTKTNHTKEQQREEWECDGLSLYFQFSFLLHVSL